MSGPVSDILVALVISPRCRAEDHQFGVVVVVAVAEGLHHVVIAVGDFLPDLFAEVADRLVAHRSVRRVSYPRNSSEEETGYVLFYLLCP